MCCAGFPSERTTGASSSTPDELRVLISRNGLKVIDKTGVVFHPLADEWRKSSDMGINYMLLAERPAQRRSVLCPAASQVSSRP